MMYLLDATISMTGPTAYNGAVKTRLPPTSEVGGSSPRPYVGKLVVAYRWLAVYSTEPRPAVYAGFPCP